jgi:hypothetical protein
MSISSPLTDTARQSLLTNCPKESVPGSGVMINNVSAAETLSASSSCAIGNRGSDESHSHSVISAAREFAHSRFHHRRPEPACQKGHRGRDSVVDLTERDRVRDLGTRKHPHVVM